MGVVAALAGHFPQGPPILVWIERSWNRDQLFIVIPVSSNDFSSATGQTWGQILLKVFKCKYFVIFQMQILLFSSNPNTFQNAFSNT